MRKSIKIALLFILFGSGVAMAQSSASASFTASVTIVEPIGITTTADLNFASLDARNGGVVTLSPDGNRSAQGDVALAEGGAGTAATFEITGEEGHTYDISLPKSQYVLTNGSDEIIIKDFTSSLDEGGSLAGGSETVKVGATLEVKPNQRPGNYTSQGGFMVTVNYN